MRGNHQIGKRIPGAPGLLWAMIEGYADLLVNNRSYGWAADLANPACKLTIRVISDGAEIASMVADQPRRDLEFIGDGGKSAYDLRFALAPSAASLEVWAEGPKYAKRLPVLARKEMTRGYQTFVDQLGDSDSFAKLERIGIPHRLDGKAVLDIGCNEGFFCIEALKRGAAKVTGIDASAEFIRRAKERNGEIEYIQGSWWNIPDAKYDLILFLSAMHYEKRPKALLDMLADHLNPGGRLILECGMDLTRKEAGWTSVKRGDGEFIYPSRAMLIGILLDRYYVRFHGSSVSQAGDPVPRFVFHASRKMPVVVFLEGASHAGKTILASLLASKERVQLFSIDTWLFDIKNACYPLPDGNPIYARLKKGFDPEYINVLIDGLTEAEAEGLAIALSKSLPLDADCVIIEGYALGRKEVKNKLRELLEKAGAYLWSLARMKVAE